MFKNFTAAIILAGVAVSAVAQNVAQVTEKSYQLPKCSKPVASVVVGKFSCKAAGCKDTTTANDNGLGALAELARLGNPDAPVNQTFPGVGEGMSSMLTTLLKETGCFDIQEREAMDELAKELALVGKKVEVQQADFMVSGAITSINMSTEKKSFGGGFIPVLGEIGFTTKTADVGVDIKLIDVNKAKVFDAKTFQANNETTSTSLGGGAFVGVGVLGGSLSSLKNTPMEPIMRDVLAQVAVYASSKLTQGRPEVIQPAIIPVAKVDEQSAPATVAQP